MHAEYPDDLYGPALPPGYQVEVLPKPDESSRIKMSKKTSGKKRKRSQSHSSSSSSSSNSCSSTSCSDSSADDSKKKVIGSDVSVRSADTGEDLFGPALPPNYFTSSASENCTTVCSFIGPVMPESEIANRQDIAEDDDDDLVGPVPDLQHNEQAKRNAMAEAIEARAKHMKNKLLNVGMPEQSASITKREDWMTELPPELGKNFGVTARKFAKKTSSTSDKDRSAWTDTPADRERKEKEMLEGNDDQPQKSVKPTSSVDCFQAAADASYRREVDEYNKLARPKSLLDMHSEKLHKKSTKSHHSKKKKKEKNADKETKKKKKKSKDRVNDDKPKKKEHKHKTTERVPFDREKDLQLTRLDDAKRKSIIKRSQELDSKFGHGQLQFL